MEPDSDDLATDANAPCPRSTPLAWLRARNLSADYWVFFEAAFFYDTGFAIYFFLFNLYLLDLHFNEQAIGLVNGALTLGALVGTLPAGWLGRKLGARPVLLFCFIVSPLLNAARCLYTPEPAQIVLAFLTGVAMCSWTVTFLPAISKLTTDANRTTAVSLIFSIGVGSSALGGALCGCLPQWLAQAGLVLQPVAVKRLILLSSCVFATIGLFPVLRLRMPSPSGVVQIASRDGGLRRFLPGGFLKRFLISMAFWSALLAAYNPFANVFLARGLHLSLARVGVVFSVAQILQLASGLLVPVVMRILGMRDGILVTQLTAALTLAAVALVHQPFVAIAFFLAFSATQWMSSPALYSLLMNETPDTERSTAAATTMFANSLVSSAATAGAGVLLTEFGYSRVLFALAVSAAAVAIGSRALLAHNEGAPLDHAAPQLRPSNLID